MTDLEQFMNVVSRLQALKEVNSFHDSETTITLRVDNNGGYGYDDFHSEWTFNKETGQLIAVAHWE